MNAIINGTFVGTAEDHYNNFGWREGSDSNLLFFTHHYLQTNPDVLAAKVNPFQHFVDHGISENRSIFTLPNNNILLYDSFFYFGERPDVFTAIMNGSFDGTADDHYNQFGWREGSDPNFWFDTSYYLDTNPDVAAAGVNPFQHFRTHGVVEGRRGNGDTSLNLGSHDFDQPFYLRQRPDVLTAIVNGSFDGTAEDHYNEFGWREGSDPNIRFDTSYYLDTNPDVAAADVNPFQHFRTHGVVEGRKNITTVTAAESVGVPADTSYELS